MIGKQRSLHLDTRFLSLSKIADGGVTLVDMRCVTRVRGAMGIKLNSCFSDKHESSAGLRLFAYISANHHFSCGVACRFKLMTPCAERAA